MSLESRGLRNWGEMTGYHWNIWSNVKSSIHVQCYTLYPSLCIECRGTNHQRSELQIFSIYSLSGFYQKPAPGFWHQCVQYPPPGKMEKLALKRTFSASIPPPVLNLGHPSTLTNSEILYYPLPYRVFSLTWPGSMQIYWNKRKRLHEKRVQLPEDWFGSPTWPPFHCFGTPIWPP